MGMDDMESPVIHRNPIENSSCDGYEMECHLGEFKVNYKEKSVFANGVRINLSEKMYTLFELLVRNSGTVVALEQIIAKLYERGPIPSQEIVKVFFCLARKRLGVFAEFALTERGRGFLWEFPSDSEVERERRRYLDARKRPPYVLIPMGDVVTLRDLPKVESSRWSVGKKVKVVTAINGGLLGLDEACRRYRGLPDEFKRWIKLYATYGEPGLRISHLEMYPV
jgi:DNA-binding winged helix-turn-helix (wHTH) protein